MSIEDQASLVEAKAQQIQQKLYEILHLCELVKRREIIGDTGYEFTDTQKQALITHYVKVKTELTALVEELP